MNAAGPWRTDTPERPGYYLVEIEIRSARGRMSVKERMFSIEFCNSHTELWAVSDPRRVIRWAEINPAETTKESDE